MPTESLHRSNFPQPETAVSPPPPSAMPRAPQHPGRVPEPDRGWTLEPVATPNCGSRDPLGDALLRLSHSRADAVSATTSGGTHLSGIATASAGRPGAERRDYPRRDASGAVSVAVLPTEGTATAAAAQELLHHQGVAGELLDLSRNGLAFVRMQPLAGGVKLIVRLCLPGQNEHLDAMAEVVRTIPIADSLWKVVAQFETPLSFEEAYRLCDHAGDTGP